MFEFGESDFRVEWHSDNKNINIDADEKIKHFDIDDDRWIYYNVSSRLAKTFYINGVRYPGTRFAWLNKIVFKFRYWWQFTRHMKNMVGK